MSIELKASEIRDQLEKRKLTREHRITAASAAAASTVQLLANRRQQDTSGLANRVAIGTKSDLSPGWVGISSSCRTATPSGNWVDAEDSSPTKSPAISMFHALRDIVAATAHDAPGIYESSAVAKINTVASKALGMPVTLNSLWSHNNPQSDGPQSVPDREAMLDKMWYSSSKGPGMEALAMQALKKLSGDLSHDNVAAAKELLKKIVN